MLFGWDYCHCSLLTHRAVGILVSSCLEFYNCSQMSNAFLVHCVNVRTTICMLAGVLQIQYLNNVSLDEVISPHSLGPLRTYVGILGHISAACSALPTSIDPHVALLPCPVLHVALSLSCNFHPDGDRWQAVAQSTSKLQNMHSSSSYVYSASSIGWTEINIHRGAVYWWGNRLQPESGNQLFILSGLSTVALFTVEEFFVGMTTTLSWITCN